MNRDLARRLQFLVAFRKNLSITIAVIYTYTAKEKFQNGFQRMLSRSLSRLRNKHDKTAFGGQLKYA